MTARLRGDRGQAFPIYIVMVAGLLFLAFAFFTVGKASAVRNGAQGAADAAALAAAQDARDGMGTDFLTALLTPDGLRDFLDGGVRFGLAHPCYVAGVFAEKNRAEVTPIGGGSGCSPGPGGDGITVEVKSLDPVGKSVIPGTEEKYATASATAVIEFRCFLPEEEPEGDGPDEGEGDEGDEPAPVAFDCDGGDQIKVDPTDLGRWDSISKTLFAVHLAD
ncbi:pilus assembly protein TadG-related protein [Streptomyces sp. NPDC127033]|uniref:pilus assembly protein TadG-related protein n=1 Tax=Streptomyces sp. NPDC127033 TaxID=3347110 RepID=UPI0036640D51